MSHSVLWNLCSNSVEAFVLDGSNEGPQCMFQILSGLEIQFGDIQTVQTQLRCHRMGYLIRVDAFCLQEF